MQKNQHDVIVIGGGINGAGIARDCAMRGMRTLLIEKHDFAHGASGNNTGMIHGGLRYLRYDVKTTKESCTDAGYIWKIAPHLVFRVPFLFPILKGDKAARLLLEGAEIFFEAYDAYQPLKGGKPHARLTKAEALKLEPGLTDDVIGAVTLDEWGIDSFRLVLLNALDAKRFGALVHTYSVFEELIRDGQGRAQGVRFFNRVTHESETHHAPVVVNATGGWGPRIASQTGIPYMLRQGKGVHLVFSHRISNYGIIIFGVDGRQMFFLPHENSAVLGTTDDDFYGDLDQPPVVEDEVKYILQAARHFFPSIDSYRLNYSYVGVRPTIYSWGKNEDALSREHAILNHAQDGVPGFYSVTGGKLASYRILAEEVSDVVARDVGNQNLCHTHDTPLPGGEASVDVGAITQKLGLPALTVSRAAYRHGAKVLDVLSPVLEDSTQGQEVCLCEPVCEAELRSCIRNEQVCQLRDLRTRTHAMFGACGGAHCLLKSSQIFASEKQLSPLEQLNSMHDAMQATYHARRPVLLGANLQSEELGRAAYFLSANLGPYFRLAERLASKNSIAPALEAPADSIATRS